MLFDDHFLALEDVDAAWQAIGRSSMVTHALSAEIINISGLLTLILCRYRFDARRRCHSIKGARLFRGEDEPTLNGSGDTVLRAEAPRQ